MLHVYVHDDAHFQYTEQFNNNNFHSRDFFLQLILWTVLDGLCCPYFYTYNCHNDNCESYDCYDHHKRYDYTYKKYLMYFRL